MVKYIIWKNIMNFVFYLNENKTIFLKNKIPDNLAFEKNYLKQYVNETVDLSIQVCHQRDRERRNRRGW